MFLNLSQNTAMVIAGALFSGWLYPGLVTHVMWAISAVFQSAESLSWQLARMVTQHYLMNTSGFRLYQLIYHCARAFVPWFCILTLVYSTRCVWHYLYAVARNRLVRVWTRLIELCSDVYPDNLRSGFRTIQIAERQVSANSHTHADAAADRVNMNNCIDNFLRNHGYDVYSISMSARDIRNGLSGCRAFYTAKDCSAPARFDDLPATAAIKLSDVDYYMDDLPELLANFRPVVLFTFVPLLTAGSVADGRYQTNNDNTITMNVLGDAEYTHALWDYNSDHVIVDTWYGSYVYLVEKLVHPLDNTRRLILLAPSRRIFGPLGWLVPGFRLKRRSLVAEGFAVSKFLVKDQVGVEEYMSISRPGTSSATTLPSSVCWTYYQKFKMSKEVPIASIEGDIRSSCAQKMSKSDTESARAFWKNCANPKFDAMLLADVFRTAPRLFERECKPMSLPPVMVPEDHTYNCYKTNSLLSEDGVHSMRSIKVKPLAETAVSPDASVTGDEVTVDRRVYEQRNTTTVRANDRINVQAAWFIRRIVGELAHMGHPTDVEEVAVRQKRPTQLSIYKRAYLWLSNASAKNAVISSFMKREAYGKVTAPRNISTLPGEVKVEYSRFLYSLVDNLYHNLPWYAFSKTPSEIEDRVVSVVRDAKFVVPTDFSKFDGTHGAWLCDQELSLLLAYFSPEYHEEIKGLYRSQYNTIGYTRYGVKYDTGFSRLSGSPETSAFNSFDNALVAFLTLCITRPNTEAGREQAWQSLGIYGGDDGLTADISCKFYEQTAAKLGLKLKAERIERPDNLVDAVPVPFLSRLYPEAWQGGVGNMADVKRAIMKLHLTSSPPSTPDSVVLVRKAQAIKLMDRATPVLTEWADAIIRLYPKVQINDDEELVMKQDVSWFARYDYEDQYSPVEDRSLALDVAARNLEVDPAIVGSVCDRLRDASTLDEIFFDTVFGTPLKIEVPCTRGLDLHTVTPTVANNDDVVASNECAFAAQLVEKLNQHKALLKKMGTGNAPSKAVKPSVDVPKVDVGSGSPAVALGVKIPRNKTPRPKRRTPNKMANAGHVEVQRVLA